MSALTGEWSVEKIRAVMVHLDRKTGLHGAELSGMFSFSGIQRDLSTRCG